MPVLQEQKTVMARCRSAGALVVTVGIEAWRFDKKVVYTSYTFAFAEIRTHSVNAYWKNPLKLLR